jgi:hypothetical protein
MDMWICVFSPWRAEERVDKVETIKVIDRERHGDRTRG